MYKHFGKRALDIAVSAAMLVVLAPVLITLWVLVRTCLGKPAIFRQKRAGKLGAPFVLYKFRSMSDARGGDGILLRDEDRLTRFGRILRSTSLDELPELWNVLTGDMSLVGPRPLLVEYLDKYSETEMRRHEVRPGITGWAQVKGRNAIRFTERFKLDVWYVNNVTFILDAEILILTIAKVFVRSGIEQPGGNEVLQPFDKRGGN